VLWAAITAKQAKYTEAIYLPLNFTIVKPS
jgi:hypothetical protein